MATNVATQPRVEGGIDPAHRRVIFAASLGTVFEWYDFYLYGALSANISKQFFSGVNETTGFIFALLAFAAGFFVRPFGALVFGRLGDLVGRKYTFLITIVIMGVSTFPGGLLPTYAAYRRRRPVILVLLRLLQGTGRGRRVWRCCDLRRGARAVRSTRALHVVGADHGRRWAFSVAARDLWCRLTLGERFDSGAGGSHSAVDRAARHLGIHPPPAPGITRVPGDESGGQVVEGAAFRIVRRLEQPQARAARAGRRYGRAGGGLVRRQFYALFFLEKILQVAAQQANLIMAAALVLGTPFFVVFGALSDRVGRKSIVLAGCALAALTYFPAFKALTHYANPALGAAVEASPVTVVADPEDCSIQFDPVGKKAFANSCDVAKAALARAGVPYSNEAGESGTLAYVRLGGDAAAERIEAFDGRALDKAAFKTAGETFTAKLKERLVDVGYPRRPTSRASTTRWWYWSAPTWCCW
jgi:hypothetical protein